MRFENPGILKVVANLISQSKGCPEMLEVKKLFVSDMISLCEHNRDNRRTVLQMSVWQEWLVSLAYIFPETEIESQISELVFQLFSILLHHAVRLEYGGWRVWVDTLAIVHSKVSWEQFRREMSQRYGSYSKRQHRLDGASSGHRSALPLSTVSRGKTEHSDGSVDLEIHEVVADLVDIVCLESKKEGSDFSGRKEKRTGSNGSYGRKLKDRGGSDGTGSDRDTPRPIYRTPEFRWSRVHIRLLSDLLNRIEDDIKEWKDHPTRNLVDFVNYSDNAVFVVNTVHIISQLVDNFVMACGGLLPLLAAATSPTSELEISDSTQQGLNIEIAVGFLIRFLNLADVMVFTSSLSFSELEAEKNMPAGGILRQTLRMVATITVRNILACRLTPEDAEAVMDDKQTAKRKAIYRLVEGVKKQLQLEDGKEELMEQTVPLQNLEHLIQEMDLTRLKAVVYRDVEEARQAQFLALAVVYFLSVLMVSRYRDILEPPQSPSPFVDSVMTSSPNSPSEKGSEEKSGGMRQSSPQSSPEVNGRMEDPESESQSAEETAAQPVKVHASKVQKDKSTDDSTETEKSDEYTGESEPAGGNSETESESKKSKSTPIASIQLSGSDVMAPGSEPETVPNTPGYDSKHLPGPGNRLNISVPHERRSWLTTKLTQALDSCGPLLREIMGDFQTFLTHTLLGTHGQEIMNDQKVLLTLRNQQGSVIELVMLLCSQEWQTSLQKHAGLAFIELVNEGRLMAHATRDHILRVANEADFILNRLRADDVAKHAEFETICAQTGLNRREEENSATI